MAFAAVLVLSLLTSDTGHCRHLLAYPVVVLITVIATWISFAQRAYRFATWLNVHPPSGRTVRATDSSSSCALCVF